MNIARESPSGANAGVRWLWLAFAWGLAEATLFFIVPDVLSSRLVLRKTRTGFAACLSSMAGALVGGSILYLLGCYSTTLPPTLSVLGHIPGISGALIEKARLSLEQQGPAALLSGISAGIPYKLYAVQAAGAGIGAVAFILTSAGVRLLRFVLVTGLAWFTGRIILSKLTAAAKLRIHTGAWLLFYSIYFFRMGF